MNHRLRKPDQVPPTVGLLSEVLLAELGLATHQEISLEETPDEGNPGVQNRKTPGDVMAVSQVVRTVRVHSGFEDTDGRFLPHLMGQGITAAGDPVDSVGKPTAQTGRLSRGCPGNTMDPGNCMKVRKAATSGRFLTTFGYFWSNPPGGGCTTNET